MLVPSHQNRQVCQRCGCLPEYPTPVCPLCNAQLAPPMIPPPGQGYGGQNIWTTQAPNFVVPQLPSYAPLVVEMLLNLVGLYGIGWLMFGKLTSGFILLVVSLVLWPVVAVVGIFTMGLGLLCLGPLAIGAMIVNLVLLSQAIKRKALRTPMQW